MAPGIDPLVSRTEAIAFGSFRVDLRAGLLLRGRTPIPLRPKTWSVLRYLAERPGVLVAKRELLDAVWADAVVSESVLSKSIGELRVALGDSFRTPRVIETVQRRGFRFIAPVSEQPPASSELGSVAADHGVSVAVGSGRSPDIGDLAPAPFVGRAEELRRLAELLAQARTGRRQVVFITGPAGIGKTALVEAFLASPEVRAAAMVARGSCVEQIGLREPYMAVLEALGRLARRFDAGRLGGLLRRVAPTWLAQTPWLIGEDEAQALERTLQFVRPERMLREFAAFMEELTDETPLVLVLEDLHWSDPSTVDLLSVLGERDDTARLLVIGTYRLAEAIVHEHPVLHVARTLKARRGYIELALSDLTVEGVQDYLRARFPGSDLPSRLAPMIHRNTDGHPLFVVGVVDSLLSRGHILNTGPGWALPVPLQMIELNIPDNVRLLIESQLDSLSPGDRAVLQAASCAGEDFSPIVVAAALGQDLADTEMRCGVLARARGFLRPAGHVEWPDRRVSPRYAFSHELYRQVVYGQITEGQCIQLHQRIGRALEAAYGARRMEVAPRLAVHFEQGRDGARAVEYLAAAAAAARQRFANREAIGYLEAALATAAREPDERARRLQELELRLALGAALAETHGYASEHVRTNYERASELCARVGSAAQRLSILYARWFVHAMRAQRKETFAIAGELARIARRRGTAENRVVADSVMVRTMFYDGRFVDAQRSMQRYLLRQASRETTANPIAYGPDPVLAATGHFAMALWFLGHPERAQTCAQDAVLRARESGRVFTLTAVLMHSALVSLLCRDTEKGYALAEESVALSAEYEFDYWHGVSSSLSGWALVQQGQAAEGSRVIERALSTMRATGATHFSTYAHAFLTEGRMRAGLIVDAMEAADAGLALARDTLDHGYEPELWRLKGELLLGVAGRPSGVESRRPGDALPHGARDVAADHGSLARSPVEAERCFRRALRLARSSGAKSLELRAATSLARAWHARGRTAEARRLLGGICGWFGPRIGTADLTEARRLLGQLKNPEVSRRAGRI